MACSGACGRTKNDSDMTNVRSDECQMLCRTEEVPGQADMMASPCDASPLLHQMPEYMCIRTPPRRHIDTVAGLHAASSIHYQHCHWCTSMHLVTLNMCQNREAEGPRQLAYCRTAPVAEQNVVPC